jgi:hypothetical protein
VLIILKETRKMQPVKVNDIRLCFAGKELEQLWFTSGSLELAPNWNDVDVTCYVSEDRDTLP